MKIVVFKYGSLHDTETFIRSHYENIASGYDNFMHLHNWNTPKLGNTIIWRTGSLWKIVRKILLKTLYRRDEYHKKVFCSTLRKINADAVLAEYGTSGVHIQEVCNKLEIPLFVHFHGTDINRKSIIEENLFNYKTLFINATGLIAVSDKMKAKMIEMHADPEKISVIPCGARIPRNIEHHRRPSDEYNLISVGRMAEVKAPSLTIASFKKYLDMGGRGQLHMIGDGPLLLSCKKMTADMGITEKVTFHGGLANDKVLEMLGKSHLYVQHSVIAPDGDSEGMPVAIMEAMGHGLPVVATKHGGITEMIEIGSDGYLVEEHDVEGMANYMLEIWSDKTKSMEMGRNAYMKAKKEYDVIKQSKKLKDIILRDVKIH